MFTVVTVATLLAVPAFAQEPAKPGPEHEILKTHAGTWDTTMKAGGAEFKGTMTYKMELGGLWLTGAFETDMGGQKYFGKSLDTYDAGKKKYVGVWADSMSTTPMMMEGTLDAKTKKMTLTGVGPDMTGKMAKWKSVSEMPDADTIHMVMYVGDAKEPMFEITYKRKK